MTKWVLNLFALGIFVFGARLAHAEDVSKPLDLPGLKMAQFDADDTYDPFADYSEFDEAQEEEADINFFRHGRFVTIGVLAGMRGFTQGSANLFTPAPGFGLFLSYFFDLRFALQFTFATSSHSFHVRGDNGQDANGTIAMSQFSLDIKYYVNTQNVTKGLAKFNPYIIGGFAGMDRTIHSENTNMGGKERGYAFDLGGGIEFPMLRNKMYFGGQLMYQLLNFKDKNTEIEFNGHVRTHSYANGDSYTLLGIIGVNF